MGKFPIWAHSIGIPNRSNLQRVMRELVACKVIFFVPDPEQPGKGMLTWNIKFAEWLPYDKRPRERAALLMLEQGNLLTFDSSKARKTGRKRKTQVSPPAVALRNISKVAYLNVSKGGCFEGLETSGAAQTIIKDFVNKENVNKEDANASLVAALPSAQVAQQVVEVPSVTLPDSPSQSQSSKVTQATFGELAPTARSVKRKGGKHGTKKPALSPEVTERLAQEKAAFAARLEELTTIWLAHPRTVKPEQMGETERRSFYSGMNKLAHSSVTPVELPKLLTTVAGWAKGTFIPDPYVLEGRLGKLRLEAKQGGTANGVTGTTPQGVHSDGQSYNRFAVKLKRRQAHA
ncbi:MAG TPA: hypothetical protein VH540_07250 [Ktedonobacterales bacterium]|jgi:hypothetical protein